MKHSKVPEIWKGQEKEYALLCETIKELEEQMERENIEEWIQKEVESGRFRNRSHAIEYALLQLMKKEKEES